MQIIEEENMMQSFSDSVRLENKKIAFVPTMGYLHDGHLSLLKQGKTHGDVVVLSIFVNPTQFGPSEDFSKYPRDMERDLDYAKQASTDVVFVPNTCNLYGKGYETYVSLEELPNYLCGISRPGHFRGVATIVTKLFNIVKPHVALFGQKDYQQLVVIKKMVQDLNFDITIIGCPIVREPDGLAMSSRNVYLDKNERQSALCLYQALHMVESDVHKGQRNVKKLVEKASEFILSHRFTEIDYVSIFNSDTLEPIDEIKSKCVMALAVKVGKTRLIDNLVIDNL